MPTKIPIAILALLVVPLVSLAESKGFKSPNINADCCNEPERWGHRHDPRDARLAIHSKDRASTLILTSEVVAVQLSDRALRDARREMDKEKNEDDDKVLERAIKTAVLSGVSVLLDHSAECPVRDLRSVDYRNGKLVFISRKGKHVLDEIQVNDQNVMASLSERDARQFVGEFRRLKDRSE